MIRRIGLRHISGSELSSIGSGFGSVIGMIGATVGGYYALDSKIETKTNHLEQKIDALSQHVTGIAITAAKIEEHIKNSSHSRA